MRKYSATTIILFIGMWHQLCKEAPKSHVSKSYCCDHRTFLGFFSTRSGASLDQSDCVLYKLQMLLYNCISWTMSICRTTVWEAVLPFYYMGFANPRAWKVFTSSSISFNLFFKVSKFSLWRLFTFLVDSLELFETLVKQIFFLIFILTNFLLLIRKSTYILYRLYI